MNFKAFSHPLILCLVFAGVASPQDNNRNRAISKKQISEGATPSAQDLFKRVSASVVVVEVLDVNDVVVGRASGVVTAPGRVVTNRHVVDAGMIWKVRQGDAKWRAFLTYVDPDHDLAQLKADGLNAPPVSLRPSSTLAVGERVYAVGAPRGLQLTLSDGLISGLRDYENGRIVQTSAAISPGSSGGGLFDASGTLIGITSFGITESQNLNFALPAEWVQSLTLAQTSNAKQQRSNSDSSEAFLRAGIALNNLQTMVQQRRLLHDRAYTIPHLDNGVSWLMGHSTLACIKDAGSPDCSDNWPLWQHASLVMLQLRMEIRAAQPSRDDVEEPFVSSAAAAWRSLADVYCKDKPTGFFTDLRDRIEVCPNTR